MIGNHGRSKFSTRDNDNDQWYYYNCASSYQGAWWYNSCTKSNLNGLYDGRGNRAITWHRWKNRWVPLKFSEMKIRNM